MAAFGGLTAVVLLSLLGDSDHKVRILIGISLMYGAFLVLFAASSIFPLSMALIFGVGMSAAAFDAMQWILLQSRVPEEMRGRVIGGWVFAIGFGWVGHIGLGGLGDLIGVQWAMGSAGAIVFAVGLVLIRFRGRIEANSIDRGNGATG